MARVSRKKGESAEVQQAVTEILPTAIYLRLSVEDNGKKDADSIENQKNILVEYVSERPYLMLYDVYTDNGFTGTDFDRPEFNRMMADAQVGKVRCIVVKDLSRLGRNYVEAGELIEKIFPFLGLRFIAVNDHYDSGSLGASDELTASLKNLMNDVYAKDISRKVGTAMKQKRLRGEYIGNYAPYGYLKDPEDKNHLVIDPEIADIVVEIFEMRASGMGIGSITRVLNKRDIPSPGRLRYERGIITNNNKRGSGLLWNRHVLTDILKNVVYIGHLAQGRSGSCLYKGIDFHWVDESEWDFVANTHEPIISMELWERTQAVNNQRTSAAKESAGRYKDIPKRKNPYGSIFVCGNCGRIMKQITSYTNRKKSGTAVYYTYKCPYSVEHGTTGCNQKSIRAADLDEAVIATIRNQMDVFLDTQKLLKRLIAAAKQKATQESPSKRIQEIQKELNHSKGLYTSLYTDMKEGLLSPEEYQYAKERYQAKIDALEQELEELKSIRTKVTETAVGTQQWNRFIEKYYDADVPSTEMITAMISKIQLQADGSIDIEFKYMNEFEEMMRECERIRKEVA